MSPRPTVSYQERARARPRRALQAPDGVHAVEGKTETSRARSQSAHGPTSGLPTGDLRERSGPSCASAHELPFPPRKLADRRTWQVAPDADTGVPCGVVCASVSPGGTCQTSNGRSPENTQKPRPKDDAASSLAKAQVGDRPMSPQDDVNRRSKLATAFTEAQQNFALDSERSRTESSRVAKKPQSGAAAANENATHQRVRRVRTRRGAARNQPMAFTREARRDILRDAVFLWRTPLLTPRISSGWAARSAVCAAVVSPEAMASLTFRRKVRMRERRALLTSWRRAF